MIDADAGAFGLAGHDAEVTIRPIIDQGRFDAVMRDPLPPRVASPYQIKREAQRREFAVMVGGVPTQTNLWEEGLRAALQADADVWESWQLISELDVEDDITDDMAAFLIGLEATAGLAGGSMEVEEYKADFFRNAVARSRR